MKRNFRSLVYTPRNFRILSLVLLVIVLVVELVEVNLLVGTIPPEIQLDNARLVLQSLVAFDGVILGFAGIVFATLLGRESGFAGLSYILVSMIATVAFFVFSVANTFYAMITLTPEGLSAASFIAPFGMALYGLTVFFFTIYFHVARVHLVGKQESWEERS